MTETAVKIPYWPRYPQDEIHRRFDAHRFCVLVAHRRMGKTVLAVNHLIKRAIVDGKERGFYAYIAPFRVQAKAIASCPTERRFASLARTTPMLCEGFILMA